MMILSASGNSSNNMMMVLLVLCACTIMIVLLRRHQFRSTTQRDLGREQLARVRDQRHLHHSMDELLIQLEEVSRRVGAQVDTKFAKLETVIRDADDRLARLERVLQQLDGRPPTRPAPTGSQPAPAPAIAPDAKNSADADSKSHPREQATDKPGDPRFQRVYDLIDAGASPIHAAEELGMPLGEVELILNLRKLG